MPVRTCRLTSSSATKSPNLRSTPSTTMACSSCAGLIGSPFRCPASPGPIRGPYGPRSRSHADARSLFHRHERGHARAQLIATFADADARGEHLIGALVGGLQVARRVFADGVDVLDHAAERLAGEAVDGDRHVLADGDVADLRFGHVDAHVELIVLEQRR